MSKKDWEKVYNKIKSKNSELFEKFLKSKEKFFPSQKFPNPFDKNANSIYADHLEKDKPGQWIPVYSSSDLSDFFSKNNIYPIRSGKAAFSPIKEKFFLNKV